MTMDLQVKQSSPPHFHFTVEHSHIDLLNIFPQNLPEELREIKKNLARVADLRVEI